MLLFHQVSHPSGNQIKSIATVDENGKVTAIKHGTALITAKADGVSKTCEVVVEPPEINLESNW